MLSYSFNDIEEAARYSKLEIRSYINKGNSSNYEYEAEYFLYTLFNTTRANHNERIIEQVVIDIRIGQPYWIVLQRDGQHMWYLEKIHLSYCEVNVYAMNEGEEIYKKYKGINDANWSDFVETTIPNMLSSDSGTDKLLKRAIQNACDPIYRKTHMEISKQEMLKIIEKEKLNKKYNIKFNYEILTNQDEIVFCCVSASDLGDVSHEFLDRIISLDNYNYVYEFIYEGGIGKYYPCRKLYPTIEEAYYEFIRRLRGRV